MIRLPEHIAMTLSHNSHLTDGSETVTNAIDLGRYFNFVSNAEREKAILTNECWVLKWDRSIGDDRIPFGFSLAAASLTTLLRHIEDTGYDAHKHIED